MIRVPLFDIDWTLLKGGNVAHMGGFVAAVQQEFGIDCTLQEIDYNGMTDRQLLVSLLTLHGVSQKEANDNMPALRQAMIDYYEAHKGQGECVALPGVKETLAVLEQHGVRRGLLTGNTEPIAWQKLGVAGIHNYFTFGAFGDATEKRVELIDIAQTRYRKLYPSTTEFQLVIVGDTPRDIECAKAGGIPSVAVATGKFDREALAQHNPDLCLESLQETEALMDFLIN